jgi:hypothetical protein
MITDFLQMIADQGEFEGMIKGLHSIEDRQTVFARDERKIRLHLLQIE